MASPYIEQHEKEQCYRHHDKLLHSIHEERYSKTTVFETFCDLPTAAIVARETLPVEVVANSARVVLVGKHLKEREGCEKAHESETVDGQNSICHQNKCWQV